MSAKDEIEPDYHAFIDSELDKMGLRVTIFSLAFGGYIIINKILFPDEVSLGSTSILASISFSLGIITLCPRIIGIYLSKIFSQMQGRPLYLVKNIYQ